MNKAIFGVTCFVTGTVAGFIGCKELLRYSIKTIPKPKGYTNYADHMKRREQMRGYRE